MWLCAAGPAGATTITFDNTSAGDAASSNNAQITGFYSNLIWTNFFLANGPAMQSSDGANGFTNGVVSAQDDAFDGSGTAGGGLANYEAEISESGGTFTFNSAYFTAGWNDNLQIVVTGHAAGNVTYTKTITALTPDSPTLVTFNWTNIETVDFLPTGGTAAAGYTGGHGENFAMDNMTINGPVTPLPKGVWGGAALLVVMGGRLGRRVCA